MAQYGHVLLVALQLLENIVIRAGFYIPWAVLENKLEHADRHSQGTHTYFWDWGVFGAAWISGHFHGGVWYLGERR